MKIMSSKLMSSTWQRCNISNLSPIISNKFASPDIWNPPPQVSNCLNWQNSVNWNKQWGYKNRKKIREAFKTKKNKNIEFFTTNMSKNIYMKSSIFFMGKLPLYLKIAWKIFWIEFKDHFLNIWTCFCNVGHFYVCVKIYFFRGLKRLFAWHNYI